MTMERKGYFFKPWIGKNYEKGFDGVKTLVLGVAHICTLECTKANHGLCMNPETVWDMDRECPVYKNSGGVLCLSESNDIEISSFIAGDARYPSYSAFTYYMLGEKDTLPENKKRKFWDSVAFTNYLQLFLDNDELDGITDEMFEQSYGAFLKLCDELKPEIICVWNDRLCSFLKNKDEDFKCLGTADMSFQLTVKVFIRNNNRPKDTFINKVRYSLKLVPEKHNESWYTNLVRRYLEAYIPIHSEDSKERSIEISLAENNLRGQLMAFVESGLLGADEYALYFKDGDDCIWTTNHKGIFISRLKRKNKLEGVGLNSSLSKMFGVKDVTKWSTSETRMKDKKGKEDKLYRIINNVLKIR